MLKSLLTYFSRKKEEITFWDRAVEKIRCRGGSPRDVTLPPGVMFMENRYLWERAVMEPISGLHDDNPVDWFFRTYVKKKAERALSISCGTGFWERRLILMGFAEQVDSFDNSSACLDWARDKAREEGMESINYWRADVNKIRLKRKKYNFVISVAALHHVYNLERLFGQINRSLKPEGLFFYDEYIGPNRMQWADDVLAEVNRSLEAMPARYRRKVAGGMKERMIRYPIEELIAIDPTEAVRSEEIVPLTEKYFDIVEKREYGGALLMPLFMNIIGNFDASRDEDRRIMDNCLEREEELLKNGDIPANGAVVVCRKRGK